MDVGTNLVVGKKIDIDIISILRRSLIGMPIFVMISVIVGIWCYIGMEIFVPSTYQATASAVVVAKENTATYLREYQYSQAITLNAGIFASDVYLNTVKSKLEDVEWKDDSLVADVGLDSNMFIFTASGATAEEAYEIVSVAIPSFDDVSDYAMAGYSLETLVSPSIDNITLVDNNAVNIAISVALVVFASLNGIIILLSFTNSKFENEHQARSGINTMCLGTIIYEPKEKKKKAKTGLLISDPTVSFKYTQNMMQLAAKIEYQMEKDGNQILCATSVLENEGKTSVISNLALAMARRGKKVLLIDLDVRKPALSILFEKEVLKTKEITLCLSENKSYDSLVTYDKLLNLSYIMGTEGFADSDIFNNTTNLRNLLDEAKKEVDYILIDSAPIGLVQDIELYGHCLDSVLLVVRQGIVNKKMVDQSINLLEQNNVNCLGYVFNAVNDKIIVPKKKA